MRMSASGLLSTIAVAIDQILRLAPSIRPPIEPVVSSTNATSTVGFAFAPENAAVDSNAAAAATNARMAKADFICSSSVPSLGTQVPPASRSREVKNKAERVQICAEQVIVAALFSAAKSARVGRNGIASRSSLDCAAGSPSIGDGVGDCA